jgi:hypothetical protein
MRVRSYVLLVVVQKFVYGIIILNKYLLRRRKID